MSIISTRHGQRILTRELKLEEIQSPRIKAAIEREELTVPPPIVIKAEPWPAALIPLKALAKRGDRGAGDIIARVIGPIGGFAFKKWYKLLFGKDCGCGKRQEILNQRWPL